MRTCSRYVVIMSSRLVVKPVRESSSLTLGKELVCSSAKCSNARVYGTARRSAKPSISNPVAPHKINTEPRPRPHSDPVKRCCPGNLPCIGRRAGGTGHRADSFPFEVIELYSVQADKSQFCNPALTDPLPLYPSQFSNYNCWFTCRYLRLINSRPCSLIIQSHYWRIYLVKFMCQMVTDDDAGRSVP